MNFVAVLAVLAVTAFSLPLLVQGGEAMGLARSASVAASLVVAVALAIVLVTRAILDARSRKVGRPAASAVSAVRRAAPSPGASRAQPVGLADAQSQGIRSGLRLIDAEEESRAGL